MSPETKEQINRMITESKFKGPGLKLGVGLCSDNSLRYLEKLMRKEVEKCFKLNPDSAGLELEKDN